MDIQNIIIEIDGESISSSPAISPKRPKWLDMEMNYPNDNFATSTVYTGISDSLYKSYLNNPSS